MGTECKHVALEPSGLCPNCNTVMVVGNNHKRHTEVASTTTVP